MKDFGNKRNMLVKDRRKSRVVAADKIVMSCGGDVMS